MISSLSTLTFNWSRLALGCKYGYPRPPARLLYMLYWHFIYPNRPALRSRFYSCFFFYPFLLARVGTHFAVRKIAIDLYELAEQYIERRRVYIINRERAYFHSVAWWTHILSSMYTLDEASKRGRSLFKEIQRIITREKCYNHTLRLLLVDDCDWEWKESGIYCCVQTSLSPYHNIQMQSTNSCETRGSLSREAHHRTYTRIYIHTYNNNKYTDGNNARCQVPLHRRRGPPARSNRMIVGANLFHWPEYTLAADVAASDALICDFKSTGYSRHVPLLSLSLDFFR